MTDWQQIKQWLGPICTSPLPTNQPAPTPQQFCSDTRRVRPGDWFLPLKGETYDGHHFIEEALAKGAAGFLCSRSYSLQLRDEVAKKGLVVNDTLAAYHALAHGWRMTFPKLKALALTGSVGKTTVKEMAAAIMEQAGRTLKSNANFNNEVGVPKTLIELNQHEFAVIECGARGPGDIRILVEMAAPTASMCINLGTAHREKFGSYEGLLNAKTEIFRFSPPGCTHITNFDDKDLLKAAQRTDHPLITFGFEPGADILIQHSELVGSTHSLSLQIFHKEKIKIRLPFLHEKAPINVGAAVAGALALGAQTQHIIAGLENFRGLDGRFQVHTLDGFTLIDDAYNASPESMLAGLRTLHYAYPAQTKALILGDMLELGQVTEKAHREIGHFCASVLKPQFIVCVGHFAKWIGEQAISDGMPANQIQIFERVEDLMAAKLKMTSLGTVIYAKSSNSIGLSRYTRDLITNR